MKPAVWVRRRWNRLRYTAVIYLPGCRICGCTDEDCSGCVERTGRPCHWVEMDLCSACAEAGQ